MEIAEIIPHIESLIFASEKPLTPVELLELINNAVAFMDDRATEDEVHQAIATIREKYQAETYAFEIREIGGGWQFLTKKDYHKTIAQLNGDKFLKKLSNAALETLSIIAYKQPVTKSEIEIIRGVNCDYAVQKLLEKEFVKKFPLDEDQKLSDVLLAEKIEPGENFMLSGKGITFNYVPYEIAAYVYGQIELFIPYKQIESYLKPEFKKLMGL